MFKDTDVKYECILHIYEHTGFSLLLSALFLPTNDLKSPKSLHILLALGKGNLILTVYTAYYKLFVTNIILDLFSYSESKSVAYWLCKASHFSLGQFSHL